MFTTQDRGKCEYVVGGRGTFFQPQGLLRPGSSGQHSWPWPWVNEGEKLRRRAPTCSRAGPGREGSSWASDWLQKPHAGPDPANLEQLLQGLSPLSLAVRSQGFSGPPTLLGTTEHRTE